MDFSESVRYLSGLKHRGWRLGLDRMVEFLKLLDDPHLCGAKFLHIAGTNGKGSVARHIECVLLRAGCRVGGFYSPYVYSIRERVTIGTEPISESLFAEAAQAVQPAAVHLEAGELGGPTEFEFKTAMAFWIYRKLSTEYVALETGLGGRLDATNVVTPVVSVITEIGLDHEKYLGYSLEEIASEKAGIIKPGVPCISGVTSPNACSSIDARAEQVGSELWQLGRELSLKHHASEFEVSTPIGSVDGLQLKNDTAFGRRNAAVAVAAVLAARVSLGDDAIRAGIKMDPLPGRLERVQAKRTMVLDGAHNAQSARAVAEFLKSYDLVYSSSTGHDPRPALAELSVGAEKIYLCPIDTDRGLPLSEIVRAAQDLDLRFRAHPSVASALQQALTSGPSDRPVLVAGSFYMLAEAKAAASQHLTNPE